MWLRTYTRRHRASADIPSRPDGRPTCRRAWRGASARRRGRPLESGRCPSARGPRRRRRLRPQRRTGPRRDAVRSVEAHAPCGERIKVRGLHDRVAVGAGELRRELVRHDHHDVRSLGHVQDATAILNARSMTLSSGFQSPSCARMCSTHSSIGRAVSTRISGDVGASYGAEIPLNSGMSPARALA